MLNDKIAQELVNESSQIILRNVRGCQVTDLLNSKRKSIMFKKNSLNTDRDYSRHVLIKLDPMVYQRDISEGRANVYTNFNMMIRADPECRNLPDYFYYLENEGKSLEQLFGDLAEESGDDCFNVSELFSFDHFAREIEHMKHENLIQNIDIVNQEKKIFNLKSSTFEILEEEKGLLSINPILRKTILQILSSGVSLINGIQGTGKTKLAKELIKILLKSNGTKRTLIITDSESQLDALFALLKNESLMMTEGHRVIRLGVKDVHLPGQEAEKKEDQIELEESSNPATSAPGKPKKRENIMKVHEREDLQSMDFTLNECVNLCLYHRKVLLEKLQKVAFCLDPVLKNAEYSIQTIQRILNTRISPVLDSLDFYLTSPDHQLKTFFQIFEQDEKDENYEMNREHLEERKRLEIRRKAEGKPFDPNEVYVEKYYKVKPILSEMTELELETWGDFLRRGDAAQRVELSKEGRRVPEKVAMRFLMNFARTVGRRFFAEEVRAIRVRDCVGYVNDIRRWAKDVGEYRAMEIVRDSKERKNYLLARTSKVVCLTGKSFMAQVSKFERLGLEYDTVVFMEAESLLDAEISR